MNGKLTVGMQDPPVSVVAVTLVALIAVSSRGTAAAAPLPTSWRNRPVESQGLELVTFATPLTQRPVRGRANSGSKARAACRYAFDRYEPSIWEHEYRDNIQDYQTHVCDIMSRRYHEHAMTYRAELSKCSLDKLPEAHALPSVCEHPHRPVQFNETIFSKLHYKLQCDDTERARAHSRDLPRTQTVFIEPLVGMLRHPLFCFKEFGGHGSRPHPDGRPENQFIDNKNYMVIDEWAIKRNVPFVEDSEVFAKPRAFIFDVGGSAWYDGQSQAWFTHHLQNFCLDPDGGIFVWEKKAKNPKKVLSAVPSYMRAYYHWFNTYTTADDDKWNNPLNMILSLAEPDDYVILKLDFDNYKLERRMLDTIFEHEALQNRIDELFFEHHVSVEPLLAWWGRTASTTEWQNTSLWLFTELRRRGIRAHSWV